ncbi:ROK family protein [Dyadobacter subterraneus]|uniref:ROK family protein n=1 Tax=Dyadobacter subterraneus TaxID=2773304 RepID=A0ABR9W5Z4_9BACT|nr:ROK family protein [Dyadobacter subterraneus]MBE9460871.1 ROK family protein [Dyadobacter subterraneus]
MEEKTVMAIDLGGTQIKMGLVRGAEILSSTQIDSQAGNGLRERLPEIEKCLNQLLEKASLSANDIAGLGMAIPGIIDSVDKKILTINDKYNDAPTIDLSEWAKKTWNLPLFLENDTRSALLGEWKFGKGKGYDNVVLMNLGTGIGTSAVIEGKILRGKHFQAGILGGHFMVNVKGDRCNCGNYGCAEAEASTWNLQKIVNSHPEFFDSLLFQQPQLDFKTIFRFAAAEDPLAVLVCNECLEIWSACAMNLIHAYDPEILIMGGGIMGSKEVILPYIQEKVNQNAWAIWGKVKVTEASLINTAALLGVGSLVI